MTAHNNTDGPAWISRVKASCKAWKFSSYSVSQTSSAVQGLNTGWMGYGEEESKDIYWDDSPLRRKMNPTMSFSMGKIMIFIGKKYKSRVCIWRPQPPISSINPQRGNLDPGNDGHVVCFWVEKSHPLCYFFFLRGKWRINGKLISNQSGIQANLASMESRDSSPILWEVQPLQPREWRTFPDPHLPVGSILFRQLRVRYIGGFQRCLLIVSHSLQYIFQN